MWKKCRTCSYIADGTTHYTFSKTKITRSVKTHLNCNTKNVIYMIHCTKCNKQYIGEINDALKTDLTNTDDLLTGLLLNPPPTSVSEHFISSTHHSALNTLLIPIEQIFSSCDAIRYDAKEAHYVTCQRTDLIVC